MAVISQPVIPTCSSLYCRAPKVQSFLCLFEVSVLGLCDNNIMEFADRIYYKLLRWQNVCRRYKRLVFPSPAEMRLIELMGGKVVRFKLLKDPRTHFPIAVVVRRGKLFRREKMHREVGYGRYWVDFANDLNRIIEVDGSEYHMDVVADFDREVHIKELCRRTKMEARILRIRPFEMYQNPNEVQRRVLQFLID